MQQVALGRSTLTSSRLAYGCWRVAGTNDPEHVTPDREADGRRAVLAAFEAGYTLFDLADVYCDGAGERIFGQALKEAPGMRARIVIAGKTGIRKRGKPDPLSPYRYDFSASYLIESCEASLRRLGVETMDLYQLHRPDYLMNPAEVAEAFSRLRQAGKVREFGVSNFRPSQVAALQRACPMPLLVHQFEISLHHWQPFEDGTLDQCLTEQLTPLAWSPLDKGRLGEAFPIDITSPGHALRIGVRETLDAVARDHQTSRAVIALAWLMKHPTGIVPIVGSTKPERIREACKAAEIKLSRDEWYRLLEAAKGERLP